MSALQSGTVALSIAADHPAFPGHFPGTPIIPGVVLLDEALWAIGQAIGADLSACAISSLKFLSPVQPGETLSVSYALTVPASLRFDIVSGARKIATGVLKLATP